MQTVNDIRARFRELLERGETVQDRGGGRVLEIIGASFRATEPAIFGTVNEDYIERELQWYRTQTLSINTFPEPVPEIWRQIAGEDGAVNSNYGWCLWHPDNGSQYQHVLQELQHNPASRRAVAIYTRPTIWQDYRRQGCNDFICTSTVQYFIRQDRLEVVVSMRSNDVVYGYKNDYAWQAYVQRLFCRDLEIEPGNIQWNAGSLHIYERHWSLLEK